jgi:CubicO group peptidase (beta-lactamase class C family)
VTQHRQKFPQGLSRRALFAALLAAPACAETNPSPVLLNGGIGRNSAGPNMALYADALGHFPRADRANWWRPSHSVDSFSRLDEVFPSTISAARANASAWRRASSEPVIFYDGTPRLGAGRFGLDAYLARNPTTGLLIAQDGEILVERYQYGRTDQHRLTSFSMAKTLIAMLIGLAVAEGRIRSIEDTAASYVPALAGTEYGATPIRHLLTMSSGVAFREEYDGADDSARLSALSFRRQSAGGAAVPPHFNQRIAPPGQRWYYASGETFVLALVLRQAIGRPIADYFSEKIWRPLGAEAPASWLTDASGLEIGYMGFNAVLRDYARLGMMLARRGEAQGQQLVPPAWFAEMTRAHFPPNATGRYFGYGFQTWVFPAMDGSFALLGVRGQTLFVDPARRLVLVHTAVRPDARDPGGAETNALWRGVLRAV